MKKLLKAYNLAYNSEYYAMIRESYTNGQRKQAKEQMLAMPKANRIEFVKDCIYELDVHPAEHIYYFNILTGLIW